MVAKYLKKSSIIVPTVQKADVFVFIGRASTQEQTSSVQLQLERCTDWAERKGVDLVVPLSQDEMLFSGKKDMEERPDLLYALDQIRKGKARGIVATKLDRICRSIQTFAKLLEEMEKIGGELIILDLGIDTTSVNSKLMLHIISAMAQWERETIVTRVKEGMDQAQENGTKWGRHAPFGYCWVNGKIAPDPEEQRFIEWVKLKYQPGPGGRGTKDRFSYKALELMAFHAGFRNRVGGVYQKGEIRKAYFWQPNPVWEEKIKTG